MLRRTRIKICGITRLEDAQAAARAGADSIGLAFHPPSPRFIDIAPALEIRRALPPYLTVTAVFLDDDEDWITEVVHRVRPDCLQFHGNEDEAFCTAWLLPYVKSIAMASTADIAAFAEGYPSAQGFLLDSNAAGRMGGTGDTFDWSDIPESFDYPLVLAGGIKPSNVAEAIARLRPWGVDVSSGVEVSKGIKSAELIEALVREVKRGDETDN